MGVEAVDGRGKEQNILMNCPHCQRQLPDPSVATCPFCGMPINAAAGHDPYAGPTMMQGGDPGQTAWNPPPGAEPARPDWNQPMPEPPAYTPPAATPPGEQPTLLYGQQPGYTPPGYTPQPQTPAYGQPPTP